VPILEYHVIADPPVGTPDLGLYTSPATFREQVAWLAGHGYHAVTLDAVYRRWFSNSQLPPKPVVFTFDDGYPQDVTEALPILRAEHWSAVLNLRIGNLVPQRVRELIAAGWEIDAHTFTHPDLMQVGPAQLRREVRSARIWIQNVFHEPVDFFCYPYGRYDAMVVDEVRRAGYLGAETELPGRASPADGVYTLRRLEILRSGGLAGFERSVGAG
jgi:peptidoglycan/xylan/chitin deacetylase (PgdA/CDA1 family)